jgi:hypothetical protein
MVKPKSRSFAEIAASKRATFISYREVVEKLAADTGDTLNEIAAGLKAGKIHKENTACIYGPEQAVGRYTGDAPFAELLNATIRNGTIKPAQFEAHEDDANPDEFGWMREPLFASLRAADLPCPDHCCNPNRIGHI